MDDRLGLLNESLQCSSFVAFEVGHRRPWSEFASYREKLERYDLVESEGSSRWDRWYVVDETLEAPLRDATAV